VKETSTRTPKLEGPRIEAGWGDVLNKQATSPLLHQPGPVGPDLGSSPGGLQGEAPAVKRLSGVSEC